jgi:tetratricopeptide (TPR) repeat protein
MKKAIGLLLLVITTLNAYSQSSEEIILLAQDLVSQKKYESAYRWLERADPNNINPEILLLKEEILLNYHVTTNMFQSFGLKDLEENETIDELRKKKGEFKPYTFEAESIFNALIVTYPEKCELYKGIADYFYKGSTIYKGGWIKSGEELNLILEKNYKNAIEKSCGDYLSYNYMGKAAHNKADYRMTASYLYQSIEMKYEQGDAHFYIADAFQKMNEKDLAIKYYKNSISLYSDTIIQSAIADSIGNIYLQLNSPDSALVYYEIANSKSPGKIGNLKVLLDLYQKKNDKKYEKTALEILALAPYDLDTYSLLESIYYSNQKEDQIIAFYKSLLGNSKTNTQTKGLVNLSLGKLYLEKDKKLSKQYLLTAKEICKKIYAANDRVMLAIDGCLAKAEMK